jgi:hypothetical protein
MFASPVLEHSLRDTRTIVADRPKRKGKECYQPMACPLPLKRRTSACPAGSSVKAIYPWLRDESM